MALSRLVSTPELLTTLSRFSYAASASHGDVQCTRYTAAHRNRTSSLHLTSVRRYPDPPALPLPTNVCEIFANETGRFTPERARDIAAPVFLYSKGENGPRPHDQNVRSFGPSDTTGKCVDTHVDSYDCFGAVSLNGTMQSNVPKPFSSRGKSTHLNMPGGQWARDGKYIAEDMQNSHYRSTRLPQFKLKNGPTCNFMVTWSPLPTMYQGGYILSMAYSTNIPDQQRPDLDMQSGSKKLTASQAKKLRFRQLMKEYGYVVVVLHITISLISLMGFYTAVASGVDIQSLVKVIAGSKSEDFQNMLAGSSTFVIAYTIHKLFAPVRLSITFGATPLLVRLLRKGGLVKKPKPKPPL